MGFFSKLFNIFTKSIGGGGSSGIARGLVDLFGKVKLGKGKGKAVAPKTVKELPKGLPEVEERLYSAADAIHELREYQDQITELLTTFDFDTDLIEAVTELNIEELADTDFMRLNGALERMRRYMLAYLGGYLEQEDFDYEYFENELMQSIPEFGKKLQAVRSRQVKDIFVQGAKGGKITAKGAAQAGVDFIGGAGI